MSFKAGYILFGLLSLAAYIIAFGCASMISGWAVGMVAAVTIMPLLDRLQEACWEEHKRQKQSRISSPAFSQPKGDSK